MDLMSGNSRVKEIRIEALNISLSLRPIPISTSRAISKAMKSVTDEINKLSRTNMMVNKQIEVLGAEFSAGKLPADSFMDRTRALSEKLSNEMPEDLDWRTAETILKIFNILLSYYGHSFDGSAIEDRVTMSEMIDVLSEQVTLNSENDFLLSPLRVLLELVKKVPQQMAAATANLSQ